MSAGLPRKWLRLARRLQAEVLVAPGGMGFVFRGDTDLASDGISDLQPFVSDFGSCALVGGAETAPVVAFPECAPEGASFVLADAARLLRLLHGARRVRLAVATIDDDADDGFETRVMLGPAMATAELLSQCDMLYGSFAPRDGSTAGAAKISLAADKAFVSDGDVLGADLADAAVKRIEDAVVAKVRLGCVTKELRAAFAHAHDAGLGTPATRVWLCVPLARLPAAAAPDERWQRFGVPPAAVSVRGIDLLRSYDPTLPRDRDRFFVGPDAAPGQPRIVLFSTKRDADGTEMSACDCARRFARLPEARGMMIFAHDIGGYPQKVETQNRSGRRTVAEIVQRYRECKAYFAANLAGLREILEGRVFQGFTGFVPAGFGDRRENTGRFTYEFLMEHRATFAYIDLDCDPAHNPHIFEQADEHTRIAIEFHAYMLERLFGVRPAFEKYFITSADKTVVTTNPDGSSHVSGKVSRHAMCHYAFATMLEQRMFTNAMHAALYTIFAKVQDDPGACTEAERRFARLRIADKSGCNGSLIDFSVYKAGCQLFRLPFCSKVPAAPHGPQRRLVVAAMNRAPLPEGGEFDIVAWALVQRVPEDLPEERMLEFRLEDGREVPMMTYKQREDGSVFAFNIWSPGEGGVVPPEPGQRKRKRKDKMANRGVMDDIHRAAKGVGIARASGSGSLGTAAKASDPLRDELVQLLMMQPWALRWTIPGFVDDGKVKVVRKQGAVVGVSMSLEGTKDAEVPCLLKQRIEPVADGCASHGKCPILLFFTLRRDGAWNVSQRCPFRCMGDSRIQADPLEKLGQISARDGRRLRELLPADP